MPMNIIIEKFYYGEVIPCEKLSPNSKKFKDTCNDIFETVIFLISSGLDL